MNAATWPREDKSRERLLWIDPAAATFGDAHVGDLPSRLRRGDLLVVNDAAVLPASLVGETDEGRRVEARLVAPEKHGWKAVLFGAGDWRTRTEDRPPPPALVSGDRVTFASNLTAIVARASEGRVVTLRFTNEGDSFWSALYQHGRPVQYAYTRAPLPLFHVQSAYAAEPWAVEMPSAGRPLTFALIRDLRRRGINVARVTHAAGLSSTGDAALDATLPWPERYRVPAETVSDIEATQRARGRVVAVGTTVVRALEGVVRDRGALVPGDGVTSLRIGPGFVPRVVSGLFTGIHDPSASHFMLLQAFAGRDLLTQAYDHASLAGYAGHEFGDSCLILRDTSASRGLAAA